MTLRDATIRLAHETPTLRKALFEILGATYPRKGDDVIMTDPNLGIVGKRYPVLDVREKFTEWGPNPFAPQVLLDLAGGKKWAWAWKFYGSPPKNLRVHVDTAMKNVLAALGPAKKNFKRKTGRTRGERILEPKRTMSYADTVKLLERSPELKSGSKWGDKQTFTTSVQTGENKFQDFTVTAFQSFDGTSLDRITIYG